MEHATKTTSDRCFVVHGVSLYRRGVPCEYVCLDIQAPTCLYQTSAYYSKQDLPPLLLARHSDDTSMLDPCLLQFAAESSLPFTNMDVCPNWNVPVNDRQLGRRWH